MSTSSDFKHRQQSPGEELELLLPSDPNAELDARLFRRDSNDTEAGYDPVEMRYGYSTPIHIHHRALLLRTFVASTPVLLLALGVGCLFGVLRFAASRYHSSTPLAAPLIPSGYDVESLVSPFPFGATTPSRGDLQSELDRRLLDLNAPLSTLDCPWTTTDRQRYSSLASNGPFFLALNLYNSQQVLPTLARTLLDVATFLEPNNTHISIFENGSTDNTTLILGHLAAAFTGAGISHSILSDPRKTDWKNVDRIAQLSLYRNYALNSLSTPIVGEDGTPRPFQDLVFINDVFTCPRDVKELLWQRREQQADAVCAIDWVTTHSWFGWLGFKSVNFYDNWIARTINGNLLRSRSDLLAEMRDGIRVLFDQPGEEQSRDRFRAGLPVPVYSCWNGMIALNAAPFLGDDKVPPIRFRSAMGSSDECAGSECETLARDFWARGLRRWVMVPSVRTTYLQPVYSHPLVAEFAQRSRNVLSSLSPLIDWSAVKAPSSVVCYPWVRGWHLELPFFAKRFPPFR